jgi:DNA-binding transcriptional LysR family regulator
MARRAGAGPGSRRKTGRGGPRPITSHERRHRATGALWRDAGAGLADLLYPLQQNRKNADLPGDVVRENLAGDAPGPMRTMGRHRERSAAMDRWQAMRIFAKVAETESFAETARVMHMSAPAVTRAIAALEERIGARLLIRTTRSVKLTAAGARYVEDCRRILADIAEAEAAAAGTYANPSGTLAITAPAMFGQMHVLPIMTEYLDRYPQMAGRTLFIDRPVNIIEEGVDVAIRIGHLPDSGFTAIKVGSVRRVICGAPAYFEKHGAPLLPADLKHHRIAVPTSAWASPEWRFAEDQRVTINATLQCNTIEAAIATARAGWGLTRILHYQIGPALVAGELQIVLADFEEPPLPIHVLHPEGRHAPAKVRAFVDLAVARLRENGALN